MEKRELDSCLSSIADGDMEALARLYQHFYRPVYLLAVSRTSDPSLAEDIAQEVFLTIRTQAASYESGNARSWIFGITKNVTRYFMRRSRRETADEEAVTDAPWPAEMEKACLDGILVCAALEGLNPAEYRTTVLHVYGGLKLTEIASFTGIPYGTVLWQYATAKKKLRAFYASADAKGGLSNE